MPKGPLDLTNTKILSENWLRGVVVDNNDPQKLGRVKVFIKPLHDGINENDLPWAIPARSTRSGATDGSFGELDIPEEDSWVYVNFENNDPMKPMYHFDAPHGKSVPKQFEGGGGPVTDKINSNLINASKISEKSSPSGSYPDLRGFILKSGIMVQYDDSGSPRILIFHPSGHRQEVLQDGTEVKHIPADGQEVVVKEMQKYAGTNYVREVEANEDKLTKGNENKEVGGNVDETVGGNETREVGGNVSETIGGNETRQVGGNITSTVGGTVTKNIAGQRIIQVGASRFVMTPGGQIFLN